MAEPLAPMVPDEVVPLSMPMAPLGVMPAAEPEASGEPLTPEPVIADPLGLLVCAWAMPPTINAAVNAGADEINFMDDFFNKKPPLRREKNAPAT